MACDCVDFSNGLAYFAGALGINLIAASLHKFDQLLVRANGRSGWMYGDGEVPEYNSTKNLPEHLHVVMLYQGLDLAELLSAEDRGLLERFFG